MTTPKLISFAAPRGGAVPFGRPGGHMTTPKLISFATPRGGAVPVGRPGGH